MVLVKSSDGVVIVIFPPIAEEAIKSTKRFSLHVLRIQLDFSIFLWRFFRGWEGVGWILSFQELSLGVSLSTVVQNSHKYRR